MKKIYQADPFPRIVSLIRNLLFDGNGLEKKKKNFAFGGC